MKTLIAAYPCLHQRHHEPRIEKRFDNVLSGSPSWRAFGDVFFISVPNETETIAQAARNRFSGRPPFSRCCKIIQRMSIATVQIAFDGDAGQAGSMDVRDLGKAFAALRELVERAHSILNEDPNASVRAECRISLTSFEVSVVIDRDGDAEQLVSAVFGSPGTPGVLNIWKTRTGQKPEKPGTGGLECNTGPVKLYRQDFIRELIRQAVAPLARPGIESMAIRRGGHEVLRISKPEALAAFSDTPKYSVWYEISMEQQAPTPYPFYGSILRLVLRSAEREVDQAPYTLSDELEENPQSRGLCVLARRCHNDPTSAASDLPACFVLRMPDIGGLPVANIDDYILQFGLEMTAELKVLNKLKSDAEDAAAKPLPGEESVPELHFMFPAAGQGYTAPVLLREYVKGVSLEQWREGKPSDLSKWFLFAKRLIGLIHSIHLANATHGYISPANVMVLDHAAPGDECGPVLKLINFEHDLPDPTLHLPDRATPADRRGLCWRRIYDSPEKVWPYHDRPEDREFYDPFVPGDVFSLGQTLLYLATGKPIIRSPGRRSGT